MVFTNSAFDEQLFFFKCTRCGYGPKDFVVGRVPQSQSTLDCPVCKFPNDLHIDPNRSNFDKAYRTASELDKQARQRGEVVKRFDEI
jgi:hypothetical protein